MEDFINALKEFEINVIIPRLHEVNKHIEEGNLTSEDRFFIDYCFPILKASYESQKNILKGE